MLSSRPRPATRGHRRRCRQRWTAPAASPKPPRAWSWRWTRATARCWRWSACPATTTTCSPRASPTEAWQALTERPEPAAVQPGDRRAISARLDLQDRRRVRGAAGRRHHRPHPAGRRFRWRQRRRDLAAQRIFPVGSQPGAAVLFLDPQIRLRPRLRSRCATRWPSPTTSSSTSWAAAIRRFPRPGRRRRSATTPASLASAQPTGIELPGEARGWCPTPSGSGINYAENWLTGDTYNMSIGQGYMLATPLQIANATAAVANRGYLYRPQLVDHITDAEGKVVRPFSRLIRRGAGGCRHLDTVREGMYGAVNWPQGTAPPARAAGHHRGRQNRHRRVLPRLTTRTARRTAMTRATCPPTPGSPPLRPTWTRRSS